MIHRKLLKAGILIAVAAVLSTDGTAEARGRGRRACRPANRCCNQTTNFGAGNYGASNYGATNYGMTSPAMGNCCGSTQAVSGSTFDSNSNTVFDSNMPASSPTYIGESGTPSNQAHSVSKPVYDPQPNVTTQGAPVAPQPGVGSSEAVATPPANTTGIPSSDPESDERKSLKNPGTAPTKAPAPAANAQP